MKLKRALAIVAVAVSVPTATLLPATPAFAAEGDGIPNNEEFVLWENAGFTGPLYDFATPRFTYPASLRFIGSRESVNNSASSGANYRANQQVIAFRLSNFGGFSIRFLQFGNVVGTESWFYDRAGLARFNLDDALSSHQFSNP